MKTTVKHHLGAGPFSGHLFRLTPRHIAEASVDAGTGKRMGNIGGSQVRERLLAVTAEYPFAIAFTLCPLTVEQLMEVAGADRALRPKAARIDAEIPYSLLIYKQ